MRDYLNAKQIDECCPLWERVGADAWAFPQWAKTGRFQLYNYGSAATNNHVYKKPEPPDIAEGYHLLDIPLDVVAGKRHP